MPDKEILERVTRIETKLDLALPNLADIPELKNDVKNIKRGIGFIATLVPAVALWIGKYFSHKQ